MFMIMLSFSDEDSAILDTTYYNGYCTEKARTEESNGNESVEM